jgi:hypothetical protein
MYNKTGLSLAAALFSVYAGSSIGAQITNFQDLMTGLSQGHPVKAIVDLKHCTTTNQKFRVNEGLIGAINFNYFLKVPVPGAKKSDQFGIFTSVDHLIHDRGMGLIKMYADLFITEDGTATITGEVLDPAGSYALVEATYQCHLNTADRHTSGVSLYDLNNG